MFFLQIGPSSRVSDARACPRVLKLMYPSRTRGSLSVGETEDSMPSENGSTPSKAGWDNETAD
jgi:hypothetical protein